MDSKTFLQCTAKWHQKTQKSCPTHTEGLATLHLVLWKQAIPTSCLSHHRQKLATRHAHQ